MSAPWQLRDVQRSLRQHYTDTVYVYIPVDTPCPQCGSDDLLGGAKDVSCSVCGGDGIIRTWYASAIAARVMQVDPAHIRFAGDGTVMTGEVGDVALQTDLRNMRLLELCQKDQEGYIMVDGRRRVQVDSITINRISGHTSLDVRCYMVRDVD